jgi:alkylhydroperoxidase family enzyme
MPHIDLPSGSGDEMERLWLLRPQVSAAADAFHRAVVDNSALSIRESEAARIRIAHINGCIPCSEARLDEMERYGLDETFYSDVDDPATRSRYSVREVLAIEFAERFDAGREAFDAPYWSRLNAAYSSEEILDLAALVAKCLALGRINAVLDIHAACPLVVRPSPAALARV